MSVPRRFRPLESADRDVRIQFQELYSELIADDARNRLICDEVLQAVQEGRSPLVLTERNEHLDLLGRAIVAGIRHLVVLRGGMGRKEAQAVIARLAAIPENEARACSRRDDMIGEGFDDARLDTLFLTLPVSWHGTIAQYVGRLHRLHDRKREVRVYDYADLNVPMLARMFDRRCRGYEAVGYTNSAACQRRAGLAGGRSAARRSAVEKRLRGQRAAAGARRSRSAAGESVRSRGARRCCPTDEGVERARSATEAFLYRRLETLPETTGRFRLNAALPIPFDGNGQMEVDLLCADAGVAIELDGSQHLADAEAYRRDRRKDLLLQENGYFVLRFLAEDVGRRLDTVLDAIMRTLSHRSAINRLVTGRRRGRLVSSMEPSQYAWLLGKRTLRRISAGCSNDRQNQVLREMIKVAGVADYDRHTDFRFI